MSTTESGSPAPIARVRWLPRLLPVAFATVGFPAWRRLLPRRRLAAKARLLLFVCSGNMCRSAMAEAIACGAVPDRWRVASAGVVAASGALMPIEVVTALTELGVHANGHRSRQLTPEMIAEADVVYCMSAAHRDAVLALAPWAAGKTVRLDPDGDIADPHGRSVDEYIRCAERLRYVIAQRLEDTGPRAG